MFPLQIDIYDESEACFEFHSDFLCSAAEDCPDDDWSYAGGPGFMVQIEETSTPAIVKLRNFQCNLPLVYF